MTNEATFERRLIGLAVAACFAGAVHANPTGPTVTNGSASFATSGNTLTVTNTPGAVINWQAFSIRPDEVTRFIQSGAASAVLNRVTGPGQSAILGQLLSNGRVFLINPNGVVVGAGARIDTAGFVASSLNLSNEDFLAGRFRFTDPGNAGKVTNAGTINAHSGGLVYLVAPTVENHGVITAPNGEIMLAAGKSVELVSAANPSLRVQVQAGGEAVNVGQLIAESGRVALYGAAIRNAGTVSADSATVNAAGNVVLKASRDVTLEATSVVSANGAKGGTVEVQAEGGTLLADGRIEAKGAVDKGGDVKLLGTQVGLVGNAAVDASGARGGGSVLVGGDYQGRNPDIQNAKASYVGADATIRADATDAGDGGKVIVWADGATRFLGAASARGGANSGDGGFVEVSGKDWLAFTGTVDTSAAAGRTGTLLLDPTDITISAAATSNGTCPPAGPCFVLTGNPASANLSVANLLAALANTNVTVNTASTALSQGDITVASAVSYAGAAARTLSLTANRDITLNAGMGSTNGALTLNFNAGRNFAANAAIASRRGDVTINAGGTASLGSIDTNTGAAATAGNLTVTSNGALTQAGGTTLDVRGQATFGAGAANNITLANATNNFRANVRVTSGNDVSIRDNTAFSFGGGVSNVSGNLTVDSNGAVTQAAGATVAVGGTTTINTRAANSDVTLNLANDFGGAVSIVPVAGNVRNVNLQDTNALTLGTVTATGTFAAQAAGAITDTGNLTITGTTTLTAGAANDITLDNANNFGGQVRIVSGRNVTLNDVNTLAFGAGGNSTVSGNLSVTTAGAVTQANGLIVTGTTAINAGAANNVTLANAANNFGGAVSVTGNAVSLTDTNAIVLGTVNAAGNLAVTSNGAMTDTGNLTVAGTTTLTAGAANDITLNNANDFGGQVRIVSGRNVTVNDVNALAFGAGGTSTVSGSLSVTAGGPITQANPLTVTGATALAAGAANDITLANAANSFANVRITSGNNVSIRDNSAFSFGGGASTVSGNLTVDSNGSVTQAAGATVAVGGTTTINTRAANSDVTLNLANDFGGAVSVTPAAGNTRNVSLTDTNALTLGTVTATGTLTAQSNGAMTDAGNLTITGATTLTAGAANNITLDNANNFGGAVRIVSGNNVTLNDVNALAFAAAASTITGALTVTTAGAVTQGAAGVTVGGTTSINAGAGNDITLNNANNNFGGAVSANGRNVNLRDTNAMVLGTVTANGAGSVLTLQAGGAVTQTGVVTAPQLTATLAGAASALNLGTAANNVGQLNAVTAPGGVSLNNGNNNLVVNGNVTATNNAVSIATGTGSYTQNNFDLIAGTGAITVTADTLNLVTPNAGNNAFQTSGTLTLKPASAARTMSLAGASGFDLTATEVTAAAGGATGPIVIGDAAASTGTMTIGAPVSFGAKAVTLNAGAFTDANTVSPVTATSLALNARNAGASIGAAGANNAIDATVTNLQVSTNNGDAYVRATGAVNLGPGASTLGTGGLNLTANGAITQSGTISATGTSTLAAGAANNITLAAANNFGTVAVTSGNNVALNDVDALTLSASSFGTLTATAGGALSVNGVLNATGAGNSIVLSGPSFVNNVGAGALVVPGAGRWVVYSVDPAGDTFSGLASGNQAIWNATFAGNPPASIPAGNRYVFSMGGSPATLTFTSTDAAKVYGDVANVSGNYTVSGFVNAATYGNVFTQDTAANTFTGAPNVTSAGAPAIADVGLYPITVTVGSLASSTGYALAFNSAGQLTVSPRPITITPGPLNRPYGDPNPTTTGTLTVGGSGLVNGNTITQVDVTSPATATDPAGSAHALNASNAVFGAGLASNYSITYAPGVLTITQRPITVQANDQTRAFGDPNPATGPFTITVGSLAGADAIGSVNVTSPALPTSPAGSVWVLTNTGANFTSGNAANYAITLQNGQLTIDARPITVQANNQARAYGDPNPATGPYTITAGSLAAGEAITNVNVTSPATVLSGVGPYALTPTSANFGVGSATNYAITFVDGVLTVTPRPITVTANNQAKVYGQPDPALTFTAPTVNGDVLAGALTRVPGETVAGGPYAIMQGTVTNANNPNYNITFVNGQLVITPAALTIAADNKARQYGDPNPALTATFTGLANGDTPAAIPGVTLTTPATIASNVGNYAINAASGANANYTITYVNGQLTITPAPLSIAADDAARRFGVPNPQFTATASGFKLGQTLANLNGTLALDTPASAQSPVGIYPIVPSGVSSPNYTITFVDGRLVVGQGTPPADQALITAVERSASEQGERVVPPGERGADCLALERAGQRRVLHRCY